MPVLKKLVINILQKELNVWCGCGVWMWSLDVEFGCGVWMWSLDVEFGCGCGV